MASNGELLRVVLKYIKAAASEQLNVFTFRINTGAPDDADVLSDFAFWADNDWGDNWADFACVDQELDSVEIDVVNTDGTVKRNIGSQGVGKTGTVTGSGSVAAASGFIKADTQAPKTRGSKYIPGVGSNNLEDSEFTSETLADLVLLLAAMFSAFTGTVSDAVYQPGVVSRPTEEFIEFEESGYATGVPAYQRRRKPNVGS